MSYLKLSDICNGSYISAIPYEYGDYWNSKWHNGVDIAAAEGTPIYAAADGIVISADTLAFQDGFGNRVLLKHSDGRATLYAHMVSAPIVRKGDRVNRGQLLGYVGGTGKTQHSYGAHLHFSMFDKYEQKPNIYYGGYVLDPIKICGLGKFTLSGSRSVKINGEIFKRNLAEYYDGKDEGSESSSNNANSSKDVGSVKSLDTLAEEVWAGKWSAGDERKKKITAAGYDYDAVQKRINEKYYGSKFEPYTVHVPISDLRIRAGHGTNYVSKGYIAKGIYTIVAEENGEGAKLWGKLADGRGWIALDYANKL